MLSIYIYIYIYTIFTPQIKGKSVHIYHLLRNANKICTTFTPHFKGYKSHMSLLFMLKNALTEVVYTIYTPEYILPPFLTLDSKYSSLLKHSRQYYTGMQFTVFCNIMECSCIYSLSKKFRLWKIING